MWARDSWARRQRSKYLREVEALEVFLRAAAVMPMKQLPRLKASSSRSPANLRHYVRTSRKSGWIKWLYSQRWWASMVTKLSWSDDRPPWWETKRSLTLIKKTTVRKLITSNGSRWHRIYKQLWEGYLLKTWLPFASDIREETDDHPSHHIHLEART